MKETRRERMIDSSLEDGVWIAEERRYDAMQRPRRYAHDATMERNGAQQHATNEVCGERGNEAAGSMMMLLSSSLAGPRC